MYLHKNWQIQSSCEVQAAGEQISSAAFDAKGWHRADVPATVVGALVTGQDVSRSKLRNQILKSLPGMNYFRQKSFLPIRKCRTGVHFAAHGGIARSSPRLQERRRKWSG